MSADLTALGQSEAIFFTHEGIKLRAAACRGESSGVATGRRSA
jgi:hypothetical protein